MAWQHSSQKSKPRNVMDRWQHMACARNIHPPTHITHITHIRAHAHTCAAVGRLVGSFTRHLATSSRIALLKCFLLLSAGGREGGRRGRPGPGWESRSGQGQQRAAGEGTLRGDGGGSRGRTRPRPPTNHSTTRTPHTHPHLSPGWAAGSGWSSAAPSWAAGAQRGRARAPAPAG